jgi:hypothetical protein
VHIAVNVSDQEARSGADSPDLTTAKSDLGFYRLWLCMPQGKRSYRCKGR